MLQGCGRAYHLSCVNLTAIPDGKWECMLHHCAHCGIALGDEHVHCSGSPGSESWRVEHPANALCCVYCPAGWCSRDCFEKAHHTKTADSIFAGSCLKCGTDAAKIRRQVHFRPVILLSFADDSLFVNLMVIEYACFVFRNAYKTHA